MSARARSRRIFWWEWAHRLLARGVGFVFALPLVFFWATRPHRARADAEARRPSGARRPAGRGRLVDGRVRPGRPRRRQPVPAGHAPDARLPDLRRHHGRGARAGAAFASRRPTDGTQRFAGILVLLVLVQIFLGGLVAGLDAGMSYNTWPLMDGARRPGRSVRHRAGLAQFLREPEDGAVRPPGRRLCRCSRWRSGT